MVDSRDVCAAAGFLLLWTGLWFLHGWAAAVVVGALLVYLGVWHPLVAAWTLREK